MKIYILLYFLYLYIFILFVINSGFEYSCKPRQEPEKTFNFFYRKEKGSMWGTWVSLASGSNS